MCEAGFPFWSLVFCDFNSNNLFRKKVTNFMQYVVRIVPNILLDLDLVWYMVMFIDRMLFSFADKILSRMGEGLGFLQSVVSSSVGYLRYYSNEEGYDLEFCRYIWACFGMLGPWNTWICCHKICSQYPQVLWCCNDWDICAQSPCRKWKIQIFVSISET